MPDFGGWFSFSGRITRKQHWLSYVLLVGLAELVVIFVARISARVAEAAGMGQGLVAVIWVSEAAALLLLFVAALAGVVKRLHDRDRSGWFYLVALVPVIGTLWMLIELGFLRGTPGMNRFGPDPLARRRH